MVRLAQNQTTISTKATPTGLEPATIKERDLTGRQVTRRDSELMV